VSEKTMDIIARQNSGPPLRISLDIAARALSGPDAETARAMLVGSVSYTL